jgi:hypothetical protein
MARHKADKITQELIAARREAIKRIYFEQGADRSFSKLVPIVREKFGGPSQRVIQGWSAAEHWLEQARQYDAQRVALALRQSEEIIGAADLDEAEALWQVARQYLKAIVGRTLSLQEAKTAMSIVESALRVFSELTGSTVRRRSPAVQNNTLIVEGPGPAQRALAALEARLAQELAAVKVEGAENQLRAPAVDGN